MKLAKLEDNITAWTGDAALLFTARAVAIEKYPNVPIKYLQERVQLMVSNKNLTAYRKRHGLKGGCNIMEMEISQRFFNDYTWVKSAVEDIWLHDIKIQSMDKQQLKDGKVKVEFTEKEEYHEKRKMFFKKIEATRLLRLSYKNKLRLFKLVEFIKTKFAKTSHELPSSIVKV